MQGGGETSSTGEITRHIAAWADLEFPTNENSKTTCSSKYYRNKRMETTARTNFLSKGMLSIKPEGKSLFAVGSLLYDYLHRRF